MKLHHGFQRNSGLVVVADAVQSTLRKIHVLEVFKMLQDRFANMRRLGTAGTVGKLFQSLLNRFWQSNNQHSYISRPQSRFIR